MNASERRGARVAAWAVIGLLFGWFVLLLAWVGELSNEERASRAPVFAPRGGARDDRS